MRALSYGVGLSFLVFAAAMVAGCPAGMCLLKICEGNNCRCSISSCGDGAAFDVNQNRCRCLAGYLTVAGQCLTPAEANAFCGVGYHWENGGCAKSECRPGDELDMSTGMCIPREQVQQVASNMGVQLGQGEKLGCPAGQKLVIDGPSAACVPISQTCARDETWDGQACVKVVQCATGSIWDPAKAQCVQYAQGSESDELKVNVEQWAAANYGPNGGPGTPAFCGAFAKKPWSFGIAAGASAPVRATVMLQFPGGEISKGAVQTTTVFGASGNPVPAKGAAEVDAAAKQIFATLAKGGGRAATGSAQTTVTCAVINAAAPQPVPATGGI